MQNRYEWAWRALTVALWANLALALAPVCLWVLGYR